MEGRGIGDECRVRSRVSMTGDADFDFFVLECGEVKSSVSVSGDADFVVSRRGEVRSRVSISGEIDFVLLRRGEVRRIRVVFVVIFVGFLVGIDGSEFVDECEAFSDIKFNGGRDGAVRREFAGRTVSGSGAGAGARDGDESVRSSVSISPCEGRNSTGAGIGSTWMVAVSRNFVGVADARHASSVVCLDFPGDEATEVSRVALVARRFFAMRVFAFLAGSCDGDGDGGTGESTRSKVSTVWIGGGVLDRSTVPNSAGNVRERCIGPRLLLLVTLEGSSHIGDGDFSRSGGGAGLVP